MSFRKTKGKRKSMLRKGKMSRRYRKSRRNGGGLVGRIKEKIKESQSDNRLAELNEQIAKSNELITKIEDNPGIYPAARTGLTKEEKIKKDIIQKEIRDNFAKQVANS